MAVFAAMQTLDSANDIQNRRTPSREKGKEQQYQEQEHENVAYEVIAQVGGYTKTKRNTAGCIVFLLYRFMKRIQDVPSCFYCEEYRGTSRMDDR